MHQDCTEFVPIVTAAVFKEARIVVDKCALAFKLAPFLPKNQLIKPTYTLPGQLCIDWWHLAKVMSLENFVHRGFYVRNNTETGDTNATEAAQVNKN